MTDFSHITPARLEEIREWHRTHGMQIVHELLAEIDALTAERDHLADRVEALEAQQSDLMAERDRWRDYAAALESRCNAYEKDLEREARVEALEKVLREPVSDDEAQHVREVVRRQDAMGDPYAWHKAVENLLRERGRAVLGDKP